MKCWMKVIRRECLRLLHNPMYACCMIVFPLATLILFTSLMGNGQPTGMPVGIVDLDNSSVTRSITHQLKSFQTSSIVAHYPSVTEARKAIQRNEIYAFLYLPEGTTRELLAQRQPHISFYYSMTSLTAGALLFRDLKTISTLSGAAAAQTTLMSKGLTERQTRTFLQPIVIVLHQLENPWTDYNVYLSTMLVPGILLLFIFLITPYSIGTELKFNTQHDWLNTAGGSFLRALTGKILPQTLIFLLIISIYQTYIYGFLHFPHAGSMTTILLLSVLAVTAAQGFGIFAIAWIPSLRMSMSICSLWGVVSFSIVGTAFPVPAMDAPLQALSWLFPLRHYFMIYETSVFNGFPLHTAWQHWLCLIAFTVLPLPFISRLKHTITHYTYME